MSSLIRKVYDILFDNVLVPAAWYMITALFVLVVYNFQFHNNYLMMFLLCYHLTNAHAHIIVVGLCVCPFESCCDHYFQFISYGTK